MAPAADDLQPLGLPEPDAWSALGLTLRNEVHAGYQSRVFQADSQSGRLIVKLTDGRQADAAHHQRVELLARLAESNRDVVGPVQLGSDLVSEVGDWLVVCYPYIEGTTPDITDRTDVVAMAARLASLHDSLGLLTGAPIPPVVALRGTTARHLLGEQLIHGDFANANLIVTETGVRIIDFDDCGYGSIEFEIGNSLYMVLFDGWLANDPRRYERFRDGFVDAYRTSTSASLDDAVLDEAIRLRLDALRRWIDNPREAPIGIRTASPEWHQRLQSFIDTARP